MEESDHGLIQNITSSCLEREKKARKTCQKISSAEILSEPRTSRLLSTGAKHSTPTVAPSRLFNHAIGARLLGLLLFIYLNASSPLLQNETFKTVVIKFRQQAVF
jgi:hypothetical protein